jgi:dual specificity MAP kinase phosphatase
MVFVLYDDDTEDLAKSPLNSPLQLVLHSLHRENIEAHFLKGGLSAFQRSHNHLCAKPQTKQAKVPLFSPTTPLIHSEIDTATVSEILPFLYLGNERDAADRDRLKELGITHILNVTSHLPLFFEGEDDLTYCRLSASDSAHQNLTQYFQRAFEFIDAARKHNGKVMIHCQAGVSRSSTVVIAYIMKHSSLSMSSAFHFVKSKRTIIAPNFNFMGQLMDFEQQLTQGKIERDLALKLNLNEAS